MKSNGTVTNNDIASNILANNNNEYQNEQMITTSNNMATNNDITSNLASYYNNDEYQNEQMITTSNNSDKMVQRMIYEMIGKRQVNYEMIENFVSLAQNIGYMLEDVNDNEQKMFDLINNKIFQQRVYALISKLNVINTIYSYQPKFYLIKDRFDRQEIIKQSDALGNLIDVYSPIMAKIIDIINDYMTKNPNSKTSDRSPDRLANRPFDNLSDHLADHFPEHTQEHINILTDIKNKLVCALRTREINKLKIEEFLYKLNMKNVQNANRSMFERFQNTSSNQSIIYFVILIILIIIIAYIVKNNYN